MSAPSYRSLFEKYQDHNVLLKSKDYAHWTLPKLMPRAGVAQASAAVAGTTELIERDYQELGALLVNNLAAKLTSLLLPANRPFFGIDMSKELQARVKEKGYADSEVQAALSQHEMNASQQVFLNASYHQLTMAVAHLIVTGNVVINRDKKKKRTICYGLQNFAIRRTGQGEVADLLVREYESFAGLSRDVRAILVSRYPDKYRNAPYDINIPVFTRIMREELPNGKCNFRVSQEIENIRIGTDGVYPEHLCPWQAPTWSLVAGEHYGRGLVEDYAGGFASMSDKSEALALYGIAAMKFINLVAPGSGNTVEDLNAAETGDYVQGSNGGIQVQEAGDGPKIQAMRAEIQAHFNNLARAFMFQANTRDAERVTAYELRQQAQEANTALGGQYSALAESFQVPLAHLLLTEIEPGMLEGIITGDIQLNIIAGIPALSRGIEVQNLLQAAQDAAGVVPPLLQLDKRIDPNKIMDVIYAGQSVDTSRFHRTKEEQEQLDNAAKGEIAAQGTLDAASNAANNLQTVQAIQNLPGATQ